VKKTDSRLCQKKKKKKKKKKKPHDFSDHSELPIQRQLMTQQHTVVHFTRGWSYPVAPNPEQGRPDIFPPSKGEGHTARPAHTIPSTTLFRMD